jgi:PPK2 family polyphosphate:nucleotide phosphotransferase
MTTLDDTQSLSDALRVADGLTLADVSPRSTPGFSGGKKEGRAALAAGTKELSALQERLFADGRGGGKRSVLLVVQGMDTSGKGGVMRHVVGAVDPQGVALRSFSAPTDEERSHGFLWRIRRALPEPGMIGVFDRSHYEDVLIVRVHDLVPAPTWRRRYAAINRFEKTLVGRGTTVVKVMLHISPDEQKARLLERLERPDKHWKYDPGDVDERMHWDAYAEAYQAALDRCWAVQQLLLEHLRALDPQWPRADYDVEAEKARLLAT